MPLKITNTKKALGIILELIPQGHLIAACTLIVSLLVILVLDSNTNKALPSNTLNIELGTQSTQPPTVNILTQPALQALTSNNPLLLNLEPPFKLAPPPEPQKPAGQSLIIKPGDNLSTVFARMGLSDRDIYELFDGNKNAKGLRNMTPGQKMEFVVDSQGKLQELKYFKNSLDSLRFFRTNSGFTSQELSLKPEIRHSFRQGTINSSLFVAAKQAGLPTSLTLQLANIFGFDIDFALDIQKGDSFKVVFEEQFLEGAKIGTGSILSAEFTNAGKVFRAVRYTSKEGLTRYYAADGKGMNKAFIRTPVDIVRITSPFSLARRHPVLNTIRAHKGIDYGAPTGTPIHATGDGKVIFAGREGGYGNLIVIRHGQGYETRYGHMSSFAKGISTGSHVTQGQIIGAVGMTGLASGPHLHYEFHMNGQVRDPATVALPQSLGIAANERDRFLAATQTLVAQLNSGASNTRLAATESPTKSN